MKILFLFFSVAFVLFIRSCFLLGFFLGGGGLVVLILLVVFFFFFFFFLFFFFWGGLYLDAMKSNYFFRYI